DAVATVVLAGVAAERRLGLLRNANAVAPVGATAIFAALRGGGVLDVDAVLRVAGAFVLDERRRHAIGDENSVAAVVEELILLQFARARAFQPQPGAAVLLDEILDYLGRYVFEHDPLASILTAAILFQPHDGAVRGLDADLVLPHVAATDRGFAAAGQE